MRLAAVIIAILVASTAWAAEEKDLPPGVSVTVYNQDFAVVKERREMDIPAGLSWVKFQDVATFIDATSVNFQSLSDPATKVVEQNYEFDLVSASKLLDKYRDKDLTLILRDGRPVEGTLLNSDDAQIVLKLKDGSVAVVPRGKNIRDIVFGKLPEGLLTKPTLVWRVNSPAGGKQKVRVAYMTTGMDWRADYTLVLSEKEDAIKWDGWVTVNNHCGTTFTDAQIKLMAGDVHRVQDEGKFQSRGAVPNAPAALAAGFGGGVEEKAFAEYHLYTVNDPSTLADHETKQIEFCVRDGVAVTKKYFYRGLANGWWGTPNSKVDVEIRFKNEKAVNMGIPLPEGVVRLFKRDADGELQMLGTANIKHTPKDEELKFRMGSAFDVVGERKVTDQRRPADRVYEEDVEITLRNHKTEAVTVDVEESMTRYRQWDILKESAQGTKRDQGTRVWSVKVDANSETKLTYSVRYTW